MLSRVRAISVLVVLACGFTLISFHLVQIQLVQHGKFWRLAIVNHLHPETIAPQRGIIFDSDGNILAQTRHIYDIYLDGQLLDHPAANLPRLAQALQLPASDLIAAFNPKNRCQLLLADAGDDIITQLHTLKLNSIIYKPRSQRSYPNNELAAHLLGFTDENGRGLSGIEKELDVPLAGMPGVRWVERDAKHNEISGYQARETPAVNGDDVTLTIKLAMQHVVEEELDGIVQTYQPNAAYIIIMQPSTGEILAMGSRPTFDPNNRATFQPDNIRNRCITDIVEPGSVFKIITLAAALNEGLITLDTPIFCENGSYYYGGKILHDDEPRGTLPVLEVMSQSSNIGFCKIALNYLHEEKLYQYATAFGIGHRTGLFDQQGESAGLLRPLSKWSSLSITRIPMGQEVGATPLQMVTAMSVIANGGKLVTPRLAREIRDDSGRVVQAYQPHIVRQVITPETARQVTRALQQVTVDGTAKNIHIDGYSFAGKTGTAQKFVDGAYSHTKFVSSFLGFMPAQDPAFVALVMVDEPKTKKYYGAEVSAPIFADLAKQMAQIMNLVPDQPIPLLSANTVKPL